ncbi:MAG TPA: hypothetical protein VFT98_15300 [Myxococcota bacterium]|nr:hypothetical protein [Myxococcota bacterium]
MRTLAALVVAIWSAHLPLCMLADGHEREPSHHETEVAGAGHHDHGRSHGSPADAPAPEESCVDHCEKLMQGVPQHAPAMDAPILQAIAPIALPRIVTAAAVGAGRLAPSHDRAPPNRVLRTTVLRL